MERTPPDFPMQRLATNLTFFRLLPAAVFVFFAFCFQFVRDEGEDRAIQSAVDAISYCLREEGGCSDVPPEFRPGDGIKAPNFINNKSGIFEGV